MAKLNLPHKNDLINLWRKINGHLSERNEKKTVNRVYQPSRLLEEEKELAPFSMIAKGRKRMEEKIWQGPFRNKAGIELSALGFQNPNPLKTSCDRNQSSTKRINQRIFKETVLKETSSLWQLQTFP